MELNTHVDDNSLGIVTGSIYIPSVTGNDVLPSKTDATISSIEKSQAIASNDVLTAEIPILLAPGSDGSALTSQVAGLISNGKSLNDFFIDMAQQQADAIKRLLDGWSNNLKEIADEIQRLVTSPQYLALQQIQIHGDQSQNNISGIQNVGSINPATNSSISLTNAVDRMQVFERVPPAATLEGTNSPNQSTDSLVVPLTAIVMMGGAMTLVSGIDTTASVGKVDTSPLANGVETVTKLQEVTPQFAIADIVPYINLMVAAPIYYRSFEEAVTNAKNNEAFNYTGVAQKFAKDVIKMVADPTFITQTIVGNADASTSLETDDQNRLTRMLKLVLIGTALSLLYSVDVGKVQNNQFGGIEPQELKDLLLGNLTHSPSRLGTEQDQLYRQLIQLAQGELAMLNPNDKMDVIENLLGYLGTSRNVNHLMDPAKVFHDTLTASHYEHSLEAFDKTAV